MFFVDSLVSPKGPEVVDESFSHESTSFELGIEVSMDGLDRECRQARAFVCECWRLWRVGLWRNVPFLLIDERLDIFEPIPPTAFRHDGRRIVVVCDLFILHLISDCSTAAIMSRCLTGHVIKGRPAAHIQLASLVSVSSDCSPQLVLVFVFIFTVARVRGRARSRLPTWLGVELSPITWKTNQSVLVLSPTDTQQLTRPVLWLFLTGTSFHGAILAVIIG